MKKVLFLLFMAMYWASAAIAQASFSDVVTFPVIYTESNPLSVSSCNVARTSIFYSETNALDHQLSLGYTHYGGNSTNGTATLCYVYDVYKYDCGGSQVLKGGPPVLFRADVEECVVVKKHMSIQGWEDPIPSLINLHIPDMKANYPTGLYEIRFKKIKLVLDNCTSIPYRFSYNNGGANVFIDDNKVGSGTGTTYTSGCIPNFSNTPTGCDWKEFTQGTEPKIFFKYIQTNSYSAVNGSNNTLCANKLPSSLGANCTPYEYKWKFTRTVNGVTETQYAQGVCAKKPCGKWNYELSVGSLCMDCTGLTGTIACPFKVTGSYTYWCVGPVDTIKVPKDDSIAIGRFTAAVPKLTVIPNPANGSTASIQIPETVSAVNLVVYDNARNIRFKQPVLNRRQITLNVDGWKPGVYQCAVTLTDGRVISTSILRN